MPAYIMLSRLTEHGAETIKKNPERILEVDREMSTWGIEVMQQFAVIGEYDFVTIVEAPSNIAIAQASLELASRGSVRIETLAAIPVEELVEGFK